MIIFWGLKIPSTCLDDVHVPLVVTVVSCNRFSPSVPSTDWDSPALDLVEIGIGHVDEQREAGHPHAHLQLCAQETVGEVEHHLTLSPGLFTVDVDVVASLRYLETNSETAV